MYLESERLILRSLRQDDIEDLMDIWGDEEVMKYCGGITSREREEKSLKFYIDYEKKFGFSTYAVLTKCDYRLIGVCGFNPKNKHYDGELMYHFLQSVWGQGYASEAIGTCLEYAWKTLSFKSIYATVEKQNHVSLHLLLKFGFIQVEDFEHEYGLLLSKGEF